MNANVARRLGAALLLAAATNATACKPPAPDVAPPAPPIHPPPFRFPSTLSQAELRGLGEASKRSLRPAIATCVARAWKDDGVRSSRIVAFIAVRKDGRVNDAGFIVSKPTPGAATFLDCVRAAILRLDLSAVPWERDRNITYGVDTRVLIGGE